MNTVFFTTLLIGSSIFYFLVALFASRKTKTTTDYFLADRNLGLWTVTFTLVATQLGGGMLLGTSQEAYSIGIFGILYTLGMCLGFLILAFGLAGRLQSLNVATTAQLFETKYQSPALKKIASILSIITLFGIFVGQIVASRTIFLSVGNNSELLFLVFWFFIICRTMLGGLQAVAITDLYQVLYILLSFGGIFLYSLATSPVSFSAIIPSASQFTLFTEQLGIASLVNIILMPALFSLIEQDLAQRFFSARTTKIALSSALLASLFLLLFALIPIYFGVQAKMLGIAIATSASPLIPVINFLTNDIVVAVALGGIIAAISSTADSLLCAISSNLAQDFDFSWLGVRKNLSSAQNISFLIGASGLLCSYFITQNIIGILIGSYELSVSCLFVPLMFAYYKNKLNRNAAYGAVFAGLFGFVFFKFYSFGLPKELAGIICSAIGYYCGGLIKES